MQHFSENVMVEERLECQEVASQTKIQGKNFLEEQTANAKAQKQTNPYHFS